jgi:hypothetical protein
MVDDFLDTSALVKRHVNVLASVHGRSSLLAKLNGRSKLEIKGATA